ncbi:MAG: long-chain fatty acid--CoA ligase [Bacteroidota bacterium]
MPALVDFSTLSQLFRRTSDHYADSGRAALTYKDKRTKEWTDLTWDEVRDQAEAFAGYLHSQGIRPGDRVAILSENRPEWAFTDLGAQLLGAVNVALYTTQPASQVSYIVQDSGATVLVVSTGVQVRKAEAILDECPALKRVLVMAEMRKDYPEAFVAWDDAMAEGAAYADEHAETLAAFSDAVQPDDLAALIYTSGTTGHPKGVMLTHRNFVSNVQAALQRFPITPDDTHLSFLPLSHAFERTAGYYLMLAAGGRIAYAESIDTVSKNLPEVSPTVFVSVPRLFERVYNLIQKSLQEGPAVKRRLFDWAVETGQKVAQKQMIGKEPGPLLAAQHAVAHKLVFSNLHEKLGGQLRFAVSGGAALPKKIGEFFQAAGVPLVEGYGLTETAPVLSASPLDRPAYGTVGHVFPGVTVGIRSVASGQLIAQVSGEDYPTTLNSGEGEIVARGPNLMRGYWQNDAATADVIDDEGWFHTGDIGRFENGNLRITDRLKHMIVSKGGKNIYPGPIEEQFKTEPLIEQLMVIGEGREFLTALVVPSHEVLRLFAAEQGITAEKPSALLDDARVQKHFSQLFRAYSKESASHEKIRDFRLLSEAFSVENGLMTPTLKLRRRAIEAAHADAIDEMYAAVV